MARPPRLPSSNELLQQMAVYPGIFIPATNLMGGLDQTALRRFDFNLHFRALGSTTRASNGCPRNTPRGEARTAAGPQLVPAQSADGGLGPPPSRLTWPDSEGQWYHSATRPDQIPFNPHASPFDGLDIGLPFFVMIMPPGIENQHRLSGDAGAAAL